MTFAIGIEVEHVSVVSQSLLLWDHSLITGFIVKGFFLKIVLLQQMDCQVSTEISNSNISPAEVD